MPPEPPPTAMPAADAAPTGAALPPSRLERWRWVTFPLGVFAFSRAAILAVTGWSLTMDPRMHRPTGAFRLPALQGLCWWDCGWFTGLAERGWLEPSHTNFFPLFPLLGRWLHQLTGIPIWIALILWANAAALAGLIVIYKLFRDLEGEEAARAGLLLFASWPFAFFQATGYPESIMILTSALATALALRGRHLTAGAVLGIGVLARHLTIVAGLSLLAAQLRERGFHPRRFLLDRAFPGLLLPFAIPGIYCAWCYARFGDALSWLHARSDGWGETAWYGVWQFFRGKGWEPQIGIYVLLSLIPGAGVFLLLRKRSWWVPGAFGIGLMLVLWVIGLMGLGRYTGSCWPAFLPFGNLLARRPNLLMPTVLAFGMLQGMFLYLFSHSYPIN